MIVMEDVILNQCRCFMLYLVIQTDRWLSNGYQMCSSCLSCYERDFTKRLSGDKQSEIIKSFNSTPRCVDGLLDSDTPYFEGMVNLIYPHKLQLNKAEALLLDSDLSISNGSVSSKHYDKRNDFDFDIVESPFLDGDVPLIG